MNKHKLEIKLLNNKLEGFTLGLKRTHNAHNRLVSHIYKGSFNKLEKPMCKRGWNRNNGKEFSIWRNNLGKGICKICIKNTLEELKDN